MGNVTSNRTTWFFSSSLNQPDEGNLFNVNSDERALNEKLKGLQKDSRPLEFSSPLYQPLTPETFGVVHTPGHPETGGRFDLDKANGYPMRGDPHAGLDIKADIGTPVLASEDGVVTRAEYSESYGYVVYVNHRGGYQTRYAHMGELAVSAGDTVQKGQFIGKSDKTGNAKGSSILPHLHFEIRKAKDGVPLEDYNKRESAIDPLPFISKEKFFFEFPATGSKEKIIWP